MSEVAERYVEQIQTTAETLRRRIIAYYDGIFFLGNKILTAADRARDVAEPVAYDVKDYVSFVIANASNQTEPVSDMEKDMKNNIVELYLGISVLMLGVSSGELAGAFVFPGLLERIFDPFIEFLVLFLVPTYVYLNIRKNAAMDDTERRTCLFGFCLATGILLGHLVGGALTSIAPSVFFIPPLLLSLLVVTQCAKEKIMMVGESQFSYIMGVLFIQLFMTALFGSDPNAANHSPPPAQHHK
ncbi:hypothetical protein ANCDUO_10177 [Ancylostoma duodenale]|uniref:Uncharacterized protein n=1 Tax=Ancylostoma duodenale TaxID=51022 RepID=A0A0C2GEI9_9BILA|nr:hypothetical protein ANCDUO_10177 [Ancylostoma duodenale]